jgi:A1 cistron-splicing factor AAR2
VIVGLPVGGEFGIDLECWIVGEKFKGLCNVPPGLHFVYCSAGSKYNDLAPRTGFWVEVGAGSVVVWKWVAEWEVIEPEGEEEHMRYIDAMKRHELDGVLAPYPMGRFEDWSRLTSFISKGVVERLQSVSRIVCSDAAAEGLSCETNESNRPKLYSQIHLFFTPIPKKSFPDNASPELITKYSIDKSYLFETLLTKQYGNDWKMLLGELSFAFVCFMFGQQYAGFEQWKSLLIILCGCQDALTSHFQCFSELFQLVNEFLQHLPNDFFIDILSKNNFLIQIFGALFDVIDLSFPNPQLQENALRLKGIFEKKFSISFGEQIDEDELPVVVPLMD